MRRIILLVVCLLTTLPGVAGPVMAAPFGQQEPTPSPTPVPTSVQMDVRAGFDGAGRLGGWIPLDVDLTNQGNEVRATVKVAVGTTGPRNSFAPAPTSYELPVVLPRLSRKRYTMEVNLPTSSNRFSAQLVQDGSQEVIAQRDIALQRVPLGDYFCGVMARDVSSYDFLTALDLPAPIRRIRTAPLDPADVPERAQLLGSLDCIVLDNAATSQLRQEQLDALNLWVGTGGLLIMVGGSTAQATLSPLPAEMLPVELTGLTSLQSLDALQGLQDMPISAPGPWLVSQSRPKTDSGARVVASQDGVPLIVASRHGDGTLIYLAFDPTAKALRGWNGFEPMWRYLIAHAAVDNGVGSALVRPYLRWGRQPRLAMADFSGLPRPTLDWLWLLAGGYVVVLGTTIFFLGRRGLIGWTVLATVGVTAGTTLLAWSLAQQRAEPDVAVAHLSVVRPIEVGETTAAYAREYLSVVGRKAGAYTFQQSPDALSRGLFFPFPRPTDDSDSGWQLRVDEGSTPTIEQLTLKQNQLATVQVDRQIRDAAGVQADLRVDRGEMVGMLTNRSGGRLTDASLVVDNQITPLGTLERDEQRQIEQLLPRQAGAGNVAATTLAQTLMSASTQNRPGAAARRDWLESLFSARFIFGRMELRGPTLIGWLENGPTSLLAPTFKMGVTDLSLLVQPLNPVLPRGFEGEIPVAAMNRRDLGIGSGAPTDRDYYSVSPGESVTLQFSMPRTQGTFDLSQLRLNVEGSVAGRGRQTAPTFTVSLFNWQATEWQAWEVGPGPSIIPDGEHFMSATGDVRLRYTVDSSQSPQVREARLTRLDVTPVGSVR